MSRAISCSCRRLTSSRACLRRSARASLCCFSSLLNSSMAVSMNRLQSTNTTYCLQSVNSRYCLQNANKTHCLQSVYSMYCLRKIERISVTAVQQDLLFRCMCLLKTILVALLLCWTPVWVFRCSASGTATRVYTHTGQCQGYCKTLPADMHISSQRHHIGTRNLSCPQRRKQLVLLSVSA